MANKIHVKKDDQVIVISGKDKGTTGKVLKAVPETGRVYVEGVNIVKKHQKARTQTDPSGIIEREGSIDASNVKIVCPKCGKATRVSAVVNADGSKDRVCKKCGAVIDTVKKAK
ncbi:LSU ribosomal protein L24P [Ruminococcaceae bacterium KH2T8]|nr:LSU ribosomal protein L24P [Ruminococcaceae bacterium KH2T8]